MSLNKTDCLSCINTECILKKHCNEAGMGDFLLKKTTITYKKGQNVIIEGSPIHGLFFVYKGKIKVLNTGINGREQILRFAKAGEMLGQRGFGTHQFYPVGAIALEDSMMCHITLDVMKKMLQTLPLLTFDFMVYYADELNRSETKVRMFAHMTVREKVIDSLLYVNRKFGQTNGLINLYLSRKEIADFSGTTEEQVIRILSALKKEGLITLHGKKIAIPKIELLKKEIDEHHFYIQS